MTIKVWDDYRMELPESYWWKEKSMQAEANTWLQPNIQVSICPRPGIGNPYNSRRQLPRPRKLQLEGQESGLVDTAERKIRVRVRLHLRPHQVPDTPRTRRMRSQPSSVHSVEIPNSRNHFLPWEFQIFFRVIVSPSTRQFIPLHVHNRQDKTVPNSSLILLVIHQVNWVELFLSLLSVP